MTRLISIIQSFLSSIESGWKPYVVLILLSCFYYLPGISSFPATDRDESRFAQASRQMLESGDFVDIRFQQTPRHKKPIGIYWLQAASAALTVGRESSSIWAYRLPSFIGATLAVLMTFFFGQALFSKKTALLGAAILSSSLLLTVEAHLAKTDAVLLSAIVLMQGALGKIYLGTQKNRDTGMMAAMVFWAGCGLGILLKGPISFIIALMTLSTLMVSDKNCLLFHRLHPAKGLLLLLIMVLPWFIAISINTEGAFIKGALFSDLIPKLISGQESHGAPPGYYILLFSALFWPSSVYALWAIWPSWKNRSNRSIRFCLAWIVPFWLMFEIIPTKLPHYVLPTFPAISLLTAHFILNPKEWIKYPTNLSPIIKWIPLTLWVAIGFTLCIGLTALPLILNQQLFGESMLAVAGVFFIFACTRHFWKTGKFQLAAVCGVVGGALVFAPAFSSIFTNLKGPWISQSVVSLVQKHNQNKNHVLASVGYREPSLVFLMGTETKLTTPAGAVQHLRENPENGLALIGDKYESEFKKAAQQAKVDLVPLETIKGFNYSKGKWMVLRLFGVQER
ncbi:MAG: glycosyltransferase family 39 protein [Desulfobacterales bacterium]